ncbi:MAG: (d)CMP kinase [Bacillota bacterium]
MTTNPSTTLPNIAIDGPAGAGKTTVARDVAACLNYRHIDSGGMYRAVTLMAVERVFSPSDWEDEEALEEIARTLDIEYRSRDNETRIFLEGRDRTADLREPAVERWVSVVASAREVRHALVEKQRELALSGGVVMDGRDIGTCVLVDAPLKVFLTASTPVRIVRRLIQKRRNGSSVGWDEAAQSVINRDRIDSTRSESPLRRAEDATIIDSTQMERRDVVASIRFMVESLSREGGADD